MAKVYDEVLMVLQKKYFGLTSKAVLSRMASKLAKESVDIMRERTSDGKDVDGRKFGGYNDGYPKAKKKAIQKAKGKTPYAAKKSGDFLRLSGKLFSDMSAKVIAVDQDLTSIRIKWLMYIKPRSVKKALGLQQNTGYTRSRKTYSKKSWRFFGLSTGGSQRREEERRLLFTAQTTLDTIKRGTLV